MLIFQLLAKVGENASNF